MEHLELLLQALQEGFSSSGINTSRIIVTEGLAVTIAIYLFWVYSDNYLHLSYNPILLLVPHFLYIDKPFLPMDDFFHYLLDLFLIYVHR